jgi:hypothetical protein
MPTTARVSHSVIRPNRIRPLSSSWSSWAIAEDGASMPVASAMATGKARATASAGECPAWWVMVPVGCGAAKKPNTRTAAATVMNATVIAANTVRPRCPNQVPPATRATSSSASGIRKAARPGKNAMIAEAPAAELIAMVSTKSTISAPIGTNAAPSPNASPAAAAAPPPCGYRATSCW